MALANISVLIKMILRRLEYVSETEDHLMLRAMSDLSENKNGNDEG